MIRVSPWNVIAAALLCAFSLSSFAGDAPGKGKGFRVDFSDYKLADDPSQCPKGWSFQGKWGAPSAFLYVIKDPVTGAKVLKMDSDKAMGSILFSLVDKLDLSKTPIMRWKWKVVTLPATADGREPSKDDQAIGIYVGCGRILRKTVSYRWETETPLNAEGNATYGAGMVSVKWHCVRNKESPLNTWLVDERNLAEDFKRDFGEVPKDTAMNVSINSQYTGTKAEAYLEYVEFLPLSEAGK
jgi:hypothetical protein